jgi:hypothetical protein
VNDDEKPEKKPRAKRKRSASETAKDLANAAAKYDLLTFFVYNLRPH